MYLDHITRKLSGEAIMQLHAIVATFILLFAIVFPVHAGSFSAGININEDASPEKTGMRVYPGAVPVTKTKGDTESANIQFSFGDYGLKVVVAKLRSPDAPSLLAGFYRNELAQFGPVLDCSNAEEAKAARAKDKKFKTLTCDSDKPRKRGMQYKAGNRDDQHIVDIKPVGDGSEFSLVHVLLRSPE